MHFDKDSSTPLWSYSTNEDITAVIHQMESIIVGLEYGSDDNILFFHKSSSENAPLWKKA